MKLNSPHIEIQFSGSSTPHIIHINKKEYEFFRRHLPAYVSEKIFRTFIYDNINVFPTLFHYILFIMDYSSCRKAIIICFVAGE